MDMQDPKKMGRVGCFIGLLATPFVVISELVRQYSGSRKR